MPPRRELNDRFKAHIARARLIRHVALTSLFSVCMLGTGLAFEIVAPPHSIERAALKNSFAATRASLPDPIAPLATAAANVRDALVSVGTAAAATISETLAPLSNIPSQANDQLAAVASLPWIDALANSFYDTVCPIFGSCPEATASSPAPATTRPQPARVAVSIATTSQPTRVANQPVTQTVINQPVIERTKETVRTVVEGGVSVADVDTRMAALQQSLQSQIASVAAASHGESQTIYQTLGAVAQIDNVDDIHVTNSHWTGGNISGATISGGSVEGSSITGTLTNAINAALGTIGALTATTFTASNATTSNLYVDATTTTRGLKFAALDCSSLGNGGTLTTDASGNVVCAADDGGSGSVGGSNTQVQFNDAGALGGDSALTFNKTAGRLTTTNASTTNLSSTYASSTQGVFGSLSVGSLSGFLKATAGAISTALVDLAANVTGTLPVANGGTGWANVASGAIPFGNGTSALATTSAGTPGQVLALLNGVPTWASTTTLSTIAGTLAVGSGGTGANTFSYGLIY
jgi:hypothetical protein